MENKELELEDEVLELPTVFLPNGKEEKNNFLRVIKEPAVEYKLQQLFQINPKTWNDLKDKGILPRQANYEDILVHLFNHYKYKSDAHLRKVELTSTSSKNPDTIDNTNKIFLAEKIQKIRLDKAREEEVHLKNLAVRNELINKEEEFNLVAPMLGNIANILRNAADENPDLQEVVDKCFINLYTVGERLVKQAELDKDNYVKYMLETPIDLDTIVQSAELEIN